ncbi:MAG: hydrogenase iron-sulfur subunit [Candidatus Hodarchaeota archaeon]
MSKKETDKDWEPNIVAFLCNWCSYAGADLAGTSRIKYPANIKIIRVMCSSRINPMFVINALQQGADGVLISGCHIGDCHYIYGNYYTRRRFAILKELLAYVGIDPRRFRLSWVSASEGIRWGEVVTEIVNDIKKIGPFKKFQRKLEAVQK